MRFRSDRCGYALTMTDQTCSLKPSPASSSTDLLAQQLLDALAGHGVRGELVRVVDHDVRPGVEADMGSGDAWPGLREKVLAADIVVVATPTCPCTEVTASGSSPAPRTSAVS